MMPGVLTVTAGEEMKTLSSIASGVPMTWVNPFAPGHQGSIDALSLQRLATLEGREVTSSLVRVTGEPCEAEVGVQTECEMM